MRVVVDHEAADHVRWLARSWEAVLERRVDDYALDLRRREDRVRAAFDDPNQRVWMQLEDGHPVSMAVAVLAHDAIDETPLIELIALWTAPAKRRQGHARHLLECVRRWGRDQGVDRTSAQVDTSDEATRRLLQGAGWAPTRVNLVAKI